MTYFRTPGPLKTKDEKRASDELIHFSTCKIFGESIRADFHLCLLHVFVSIGPILIGYSWLCIIRTPSCCGLKLAYFMLIFFSVCVHFLFSRAGTECSRIRTEMVFNWNSVPMHL